jgi:UDP-N-acetylglucosamine 2-epimerase (non-hydrolysing)/GDP/UDP-N,N'-diacetylbacillosamine 2-epimerase (hydrolysing)
MRKIAAITGSRAEYGLAQPIFEAIDSRKNLELSLIVTGMHLSREFGYTVREIEKDGFKIAARIENLAPEDTGAAMARSIGRCILGVVDALEEIKPDILLVLTDLGHTLAGAIAGSHMNIPVAHLHGGDVSGTVDEFVRHAITKLSHIHLTATKQSAERIIKMGEEPWRVYVVGAPGLDTVLNKKLIEQEKIAKKFALDLKKPILLVVQHPVITEVEQAKTQMRETMEALFGLKEQSIVIYPNADAGGRRMIKVIEQYMKYPFIQMYKSLPHIEYLSLMKIASVMVGNSSSGIIEAPSFHLPVVNIGTRQAGRERSTNVIDVGYNREEIVKAVKKALHDRKFRAKVKKCKNPYGDGKASQRIVKVLSKIEITPKLLQKRITY